MIAPTWLAGLPPEAAVFLVAASPIIELRGAIPLAIAGFNFSVAKAFLISVIGNQLAVLLIYGCGDAWLKFTAARRGFLQKITDAVLARTRRRFNDQHLKYGLIGLVIFVGIPLPMTGAWTGALAAYLLGIRFRQAFIWVGLGVLLAGVVVTLATTGVIAGASLFVK